MPSALQVLPLKRRADQSRTRGCHNCVHRWGSGTYSKCYRSGSYLDQRRHYLEFCDELFSGWQRRPSLIELVRTWIGL